MSIFPLFSRVNKLPLVLVGLFSFGSMAQADTILHAFNWSYQEVGDKAQEIADIGYTKVLIAPPLKSEKSNCQWWARYQPQDIRVIEHCLGNKESLQYMINELAARGVETYADIVLNHMANERNHSTDFPSQATLEDYANHRGYWDRQKLFGSLDYGIFGAGDFHSEFCISDYNDIWQSANGRICGKAPDRGLPDINPNDWVREQQRAYLSALKNMGITGFRIDAAKHMSNWHINQIFTSEIKQGMHLFGEIIVDDRRGDNGAFDKFLQPYLNETGHGAYDFPLFKTIREAFSFNGSLRALENSSSWGGAIGGGRGVTFSVTHDIPTNDGFRYQIMDPTDEFLATVYIMGRADGTPLLLSDKTGVDNNRWFDNYSRAHTKAMVKFRAEVHGEGQENLWVDDCVFVARRGKEGLFALNKCGSDRWVAIDTNERFYWFKTYREVFTNDTFKIDSGQLSIKVPARGSAMWYAD